MELNKPESLVVSKFRAFFPRMLAHEQHLLYYMQPVEELNPEITMTLLRATRAALIDYEKNPTKVPRQIFLTMNNTYYFPVFMPGDDRTQSRAEMIGRLALRETLRSRLPGILRQVFQTDGHGEN